MRLAFVLFHWFAYGGLQRDLVKIVKACQPHADIHIYCQCWEGKQLADVVTHVIEPRGWIATAQRRNFVNDVQELVAGNYHKVIGFNRMPGLDYYYAADTSFVWRAMHKRSWIYRMMPRSRQYMAFETAVFGPNSATVSLLLSGLQRQQYAEVHHTPGQRLVDLPPGISDEHKAGPDAQALRASLRIEFGVADNELLVLQVGSSFNTKGVDRALGALASLPVTLKNRVHYLLLGQDTAQPWLKRAEQCGVKQVHIEAGRADIPRCMQGADLLLHPSRHESAGMVLLEAVVAGLPVLTTGACGYAMHVERSGAGIVCAEPFRQAELDEHLQHMLISDRARWKKQGIAYGQSQDLYSMPRHVARIILGQDAANG